MKQKLFDQFAKVKNWIRQHNRQTLCFVSCVLLLKALLTTKSLTAAVPQTFLNIATIFLAVGVICIVMSVFRLILSFAEYEEPDSRRRLKMILHLLTSGICIVIGLAIKAVLGSGSFDNLLKTCLPLAFTAAGNFLFIRLIQTLIKEDLFSLEQISKEKKAEWLKAALSGILCFMIVIVLILI